jgi:phosphate starvation-inducible PhoH-like protein
MRTEIFPIDNSEVLSALFGSLDENMNALSLDSGCEINTCLNGLMITGEDENIDLCLRTLKTLVGIIRKGERIKTHHIRMVLDLVREGTENEIDDLMDVVAVTDKGKPIKCRTYGQRKYIKAINKHDLVFCVGPAGTGKTYLAVARAVMAYKNKAVEKIILTRPAVEAGEKLGFLPGDLQTKVDPYLRPLYDGLQEMLGLENYMKMMERSIIEVAPLAYMRGRTLSNAFIILDEAQNTTVEQMKMFLTRMGEGSKMVVTGDTTQIDLPAGTRSGILNAIDVLEEVEGVEVVRLTAKDVVRHDLVQKIVNAYEKYYNAVKKHK